MQHATRLRGSGLWPIHGVPGSEIRKKRRKAPRTGRLLGSTRYTPLMMLCTH